MPVIDKEYEWINDIVNKYDTVMLDEVLEDATEIEVVLFPRNFTQDYYKKDNSNYLNQCEQIRQIIKQTTNCKVDYDFDKKNSWQFLYIVKRGEKMHIRRPKEIVEEIKEQYNDLDIWSDEQGSGGIDTKTPVHRYFIEIQSNLVNHEDDYNHNLEGMKICIEDIAKEIKKMQTIAKEIKDKYCDAVEVVLGEWNQSIQYGMTIWIFVL